MDPIAAIYGIVLAVVGIGGTLGGIGLGQWLQNRRRFDSARRAAYLEFAICLDEVRSRVWAPASAPNYQPLPVDWEARFERAAVDIELVGGAVVASKIRNIADTVKHYVNAYIEDPEPVGGSSTSLWPDSLQQLRTEFIEVTRKDLGA